MSTADTDTGHGAGRAVERGNANALRKYPLSDAATCRNDACVIPAGAIIDAQIMLFGDAASAWVSGIDADGRVHVETDDGAFAVADGPLAPGATITLHTADTGAETYAGVLVCGAADPVNALLAYGAQAFTRDETTFAESAVTRLGIPSVTGFRLDDGNIAYGDVRIVGTGGCDVATFTTRDGRRCLMVSAIGESSETARNGCISGIRLLNDNIAFTAYVHELSPFTILLSTRGARMSDGSGTFVDQNTVCAHVRKSNGSEPRALGSFISGVSGAPDTPDSPDSADAPGAEDTGDVEQPEEDDPAEPEQTAGKGLYMFVTNVYRNGAWQTTYDATREYTVGDLLVGGDNGPLAVPPNIEYDGYEYRFTGYYTIPDPMVTGSEATGERVIDATGRPAIAGTTAVEGVVTLYSHWLAVPKPATISFLPDVNPTNYGTLHIVADNTTGYDSPVQITGVQAEPVAERPLRSADVIADGGARLSERLAGPALSAGGVEISIRGMNRLNTI